MFSALLITKSKKLLQACRKQGVILATAESCTGGLVAGLLTEIPGSSDVFERGYVTYSNEAKHSSLGVNRRTLKNHGAVSAETAEEMARGTLAHSKAKFSIGITGIAGPGGGTKDKPVGLVFIATAYAGKVSVERYVFKGNRRAIRLMAVQQALNAALKRLS